MLSRVAENVYWLSRYLERMGITARLMKVYGRTLMDMPHVQPHEGWMPLITISGLDKPYLKNFDQANENDVTRFLIEDTNNPSSLLNAAMAVKNNLRGSRDMFPRQMYEKITALVQYIKSATDSGVSIKNRNTFLDTVERRLLAISGAVHGSLRHDQTYTFMRMACYLERADMTSRVLDVPSSAAVSATPTISPLANDIALEHRLWTGALNSLSAMQMYRRHVRQPINAEGCLNFLLNDEHLPGACRFCLVHLDQCLEYLHHSGNARAAVDQLLQQLNHADVATLAADADARHEFLDQLQLGLLVIGNTIATTYFPSEQEPA